MAQTGMETVEIVKGVVKQTHPDLIIAVDALAARSTRRLNRTIQVTDTGINPGSGVGTTETAEPAGDRNSGDRDRCADGCGCGNNRK